ncbi:MAG: PTS sugar transporter subunit IIA [Myxococcales bacterium]|nr:PTS sugar transporter subunit IIA [Myxococcales bacterium]
MSVEVSVGIVLVGHGRTASELLDAARSIVGADALQGVVAVDAGRGETPQLGEELCAVIERVDVGAGVLVLVDLWGASPCACAQREAAATCHQIVTLSGLNLAMLLKVAALDRRRLDAEALAQACADSGRRAVQVQRLADASQRGESQA